MAQRALSVADDATKRYCLPIAIASGDISAREGDGGRIAADGSSAVSVGHLACHGDARSDFGARTMKRAHGRI